MSAFTPLAALFFCLCALTSPARAQSDPSAGKTIRIDPIIISTGAIDASREAALKVLLAKFKPNAELVSLLAKLGYRFDKEFHVVQVKSGVRISPFLLLRAGLELTLEGKLVDAATSEPVDPVLLPKILEGLLGFAQVAKHDPKLVGLTLQKWGVPQVHDGIHLFNPDGTATYYGLMLYEGLYKFPDRVNKLSGERLSKSLSLFGDAYKQAFGENSPEVAQADLQRAWSMLSWAERKAGETPVPIKTYPDANASLKKYLELVAKGYVAAPEDSKEREQYQESLESLVMLGGYRYYPQMFLDPSQAPPELMPEFVPHGMLPKLLRVIDRLHGSPMTPEQQEAFIKSFPMGDTVWRAQAQELWRQGLTGKNVKVAVVDSGVAPHPDVEEAVGVRRNFTNQKGIGAYGAHAMHVAGIIHALAPDATINSYKGIEEGGPQENERKKVSEETVIEARIMKAIDAAVADGNDIINLSLAGKGIPGGALAQKVEEYAKKGVIFVVAAGNEGSDGVASPSIAASALTVGSLDANGRLSTFSSYGEVWDPTRLSYAVKSIFMVPGENVNSTTLGGYDRDSGTSMAAPNLAGSVA
ncbi:MAG TPA: hypothetical protein DD417_03260, partial [Elusimicrobia bacterium]|nr:hypothetical protein [Elusimicrobiota bacterium]